MNIAVNLHPERSPSDRSDGGAVDSLIRDALSRATDRSKLAHSRTLEALDILAGRLQSVERARVAPEPPRTAAMLTALSEKLEQLEAMVAAGHLERIGRSQDDIGRRIEDIDRKLPADPQAVREALDRVEARIDAAQSTHAATETAIGRALDARLGRVAERVEKVLDDDRKARAAEGSGLAEIVRSVDHLAGKVEAQISPVAQDLKRIVERFESDRGPAAAAELAQALAALEEERRLLSRLPAIEEALNRTAVPGQSGAETSVEDLRRDLGDLRALQEATDRRTLDALQSVQRALEMLAVRSPEPRLGTPSREAPPADDIPADARAMLAAARAAAARAVEEMGPVEREASRARLIGNAPAQDVPALPTTEPEIAGALPAASGGPAETAVPQQTTGSIQSDLAEVIRSIRTAAKENNRTAEPAASPRRVMAKPVLMGLTAITLVAGGVQAAHWFADGKVSVPFMTGSAKPAPAAPASALTTGGLLSPGNGLRPSAAISPEVPADMREGFNPADHDMAFKVALRYLDGVGVTRDPRLAETWLRTAADKGSAKAAYRLGAIFEKGLLGTKDPDAAKDWYRKAGEKGNVSAMHNYAVLMAGAEQPDYVQASTWFRKAAEFGLRDSQYNAAVLAARGLGGAADMKSAYVWFSLAAAAGDTAAASRRDEAARRLDPATLAAAKTQLQAFQPKSPDPATNEPVGAS